VTFHALNESRVTFPMTTAVNVTGSRNVISIIKQSTSLATSSRPGRSL